MTMPARVKFLLSFFALLILPPGLAAQEKYPVKPIKIVVALGPGSVADAVARLVGESLRRELNTEVVVEHKPGPAIAGLLGGHIDTVSLVWPALSEHVRAGKFRALAVTSPIKELPELPTFAALGFPQVNLEVFFGLFGPAGLPKLAAGKLIPALEKAVKDPAHVAKLDKIGFAVAYEGPKELSERIGKELTVVRDVARRSGIKQE